jgi:hypothetical protein
LREAAELVV